MNSRDFSHDVFFEEKSHDVFFEKKILVIDDTIQNLFSHDVFFEKKSHDDFFEEKIAIDDIIQSLENEKISKRRYLLKIHLLKRIIISMLKFEI